jgi:2,3-bisphosphoglycerate-dependent phosphoglycerate mutase
MAKLILVRHGKSEWNKTGQWTGWTDIDLAEEGVEEARRVAEAIQDIDVDIAYVSELKRAKQTLDEIKKQTKREISTRSSSALNERHYGIYTGKNKWEVKKEIGDEKFQELRRGWDVKIPDGESLKEVYERVIPYFENHIKPDIEAGKNVLVVAHGNSLRALVKHLDKISDSAICEVELGTGEAHCYTFKDGKITAEREVRAVNAGKHKV